MSNSDNNTTKYYDLHTRGAGFINRFREVKPKAGGRKFKPFFSVSVGAFRGSSDNVEYTNFDTTISGKEALEILSKHQDAINNQEVRVIAGFTIGDIYPYSYTVKKNDKEEGRCGIKGRFLKVSFLKIDGEMVYKYEKPQTDDESTNDQSQNNEIDSVEPSQVVADDSKVDEPQAQNTEECPFEEQLSNQVSLSQDDPNFDEKKDWLKAQGYKWNSEQQCWELPQA